MKAFHRRLQARRVEPCTQEPFCIAILVAARPARSAVASDANNDACAIVTKPDAAALVGSPVTSSHTGRREATPAFPAIGVCQYFFADPSAGVQVNVSAPSRIADFVIDPSTHGAKHVKGVGDDAIVYEALGIITVRKGKATVFVTASLGKGKRPTLASSPPSVRPQLNA